ncbi:MAG: zf-HC2 domain-containing protein [Phycisphaeraceae bacterium]|nr:zf-HC2 domain-containing protein [Phycisphaeraceae bacterium]
MTCKEFVDFMMTYLDGELPEAERARFEAHLKDCTCCLHFMETYRQAVAMGKKCHNCEEDGQTLSSNVPEHLIQAILAARRRPTPD